LAVNHSEQIAIQAASANGERVARTAALWTLDTYLPEYCCFIEESARLHDSLEVAVGWYTSPSVGIKNPVIYSFIAGKAITLAIAGVAVVRTGLADKDRGVSVIPCWAICQTEATYIQEGAIGARSADAGRLAGAAVRWTGDTNGQVVIEEARNGNASVCRLVEYSKIMVCVTRCAVPPPITSVAIVGAGLALPRESIAVVVRRAVLAATVTEEEVDWTTACA